METTAERVHKMEFQCTQCGAKDAIKLWPNDLKPVAFGCYSCKAGMSMDVASQVQTQTGMFPVPVATA